MHYYQHHIGDFIRDTSCLSNSQSAAYLRLLWIYYESESPLPDDTEVLAMRVGSTPADVSLLLRAFFKKDGDVWRHSRCDREIAEYHEIVERNRHNGKLGGRPKKKPSGFPDGSQTVPSGNPVAPQSQPSGNPDETLTNNQEPITNNQYIDTSADKLPTCPQDQIVSLYHKHLPELPKVRLMTDKRKKAIRKFWEFVLTSKRSDGERRATDEQTALDWIDAFFLRARDNDFLMGRIPKIGSHANWQADLDFLLSDKGILQVIEKTRESA